MRSFQARAVIFDLDGVLVDSEPLFLKALNRILIAEGARPLTEEENRGLVGTTVENTWSGIREMRALPKSADYYLDRYDQVVLRIFEEDLELQPGARRLVDEVRARGLPMGLATGSRRKWVDVKLRVVGLDGVFDAIIAGDEIQHGKPAPDTYLEVARRLRVPPHQCLAVEDSPTGVAAAVAAGMYTVAVRTDFTAGMDVSRANVVLDSLEEFDMGLVGSSILSGDGT